jgi:hypothetical protein
MRKSTPAPNPNAYVAGLTGWQRTCVESLRKAVRATPTLVEVVKWGHLVYVSNGPVLLIRAEESRVLFGFWRGKRLRALEPRLNPSGKYEMATLALREGDTIGAAAARRLVQEAVALNAALGNPQDAAPRKAAKTVSKPRSRSHARSAR